MIASDIKRSLAIPPRILAYIAHQVAVPVEAFARYGMRGNTTYEDLDEIRALVGYTKYSWRAARRLMAHLLLLALESERPLPLVEAALEYLRTKKVIAPGITTAEDLIRGSASGPSGRSNASWSNP